MKNLFSLLFWIGISIGAAFGQSDSDSHNTINYDLGWSAEFYNQGEYGIGLGAIVGKNMGHKTNPNYSFGIYTDLFFVETPIIGPRLKLSYNYLSILGVNLNFASYYHEGLNDVRITPEINFSMYGIVNFFLGYSFNINGYSMHEVSKFKVGVNINVVRSNK
jgi:hypothetical protein